MIHRPARALAAAVVALGTAGCAAAGEPAVAAAAPQFAGAAARQDGAACALLSDDARRSTESFDRDCASQLATLPDPGAVQRVEVWGDTAQVRLTGDTVFLLEFPDGWRVSAAGCTLEEEAPYQCEVQG